MSTSTQPRLLSISDWTATADEPLLDLTLGSLLRSVASEVPDRDALVEGVEDPAARRRWTYAALLREAEATARFLLTHFQPGERVIIYGANSPEWVCCNMVVL